MLDAAGIEPARREAEWLVEAVTGENRTSLAGSEYVDDGDGARALDLARRRVAGEPLQYLTGIAGFRRLELAVGPGVLIPRPETELVVERALARLPDTGIAVDIGTGSGAIALAIKDERPAATVFATEISAEALAWARKNRAALGLEIEMIEGDLFEGLPAELHGRVDVVVANPPYIDQTESSDLLPEVVDHEPHVALFAEEEGMAILEQIIAGAIEWLKPEGWLVLEIDERRGADVIDLLGGAGYVHAAIYDDYASKPRIAEARRP